MRLIRLLLAVGVLLTGVVIFGAGSALAHSSKGVYFQTNGEPNN